MGNVDTIPTTGTLVVVTCWCGIQHAIPSSMNRWVDGSETNHVFCPLGHTWVRRTTDRDRLAAAESRQRHLEDQLQAAELEAEKVRVRLIRDRHRFANGVCPCCNRSFENVARHMTTQHPDYDAAVIAAPAYECSCGRSFETPHGLRVHQARSRRDGWAEPSTSRYRRHLTVT